MKLDKYSAIRYWAAVIGSLIVGFSIGTNFGCTEEQRQVGDRFAKDVNQWSDVGRHVLDSPAGQTIPPPIGLIAASVIAVASGAANGWQKYRGDQMKKTTRAIVRGVESSGNPDKATSEVKANIAEAMRSEGGEKFYRRANKIVDILKMDA